MRRKILDEIFILKTGNSFFIIRKFVKENEADFLVSLLEKKGINTILETGVGYTSCILMDKLFSLGPKGKKLITVGSDLISDFSYWTKEREIYWKIRHNVPKKYLTAKYGKRVFGVWGWHAVEIKKNLEKVLEGYKNLTIDLFFHDSDHSTAHRFLEWNIVEPYLSKNAYFVSHDYGLWKKFGGKEFFDWFEKEKVETGEWEKVGVVESTICYRKKG